MESVSEEFGFGGRLSKEFPSQIIMDITEVCNLACTHCPHPVFKLSEHYEGRFLPVELNEKLIEEVATHGRGSTNYIRYTGSGEPLIHPQGYEMIDSAVRNSGVHVTLTTNGKILNEKRMQKIIESGVHMIDVSIDAFKPATYAAIRVGGNLEVTRANVLRLINWVRQSKSPTKVVVSFIEQPSNRAEIADFESYWRDNGAHQVVIRRLHSAAGGNVPLAIQKREELAEVKRYPCLYPWERVVLNARGDLAFCPADWTHGSRVADYSKVSILETWQGKFYSDLRLAHEENNFSGHSFCGQCPDWAETRWPHQGLSYSDLVEDLLGSPGGLA